MPLEGEPITTDCWVNNLALPWLAKNRDLLLQHVLPLPRPPRCVIDHREAVTARAPRLPPQRQVQQEEEEEEEVVAVMMMMMMIPAAIPPLDQDPLREDDAD